jgi:hypothetical protein
MNGEGGNVAVRSNWDTATGEVRVLMDVATAQELVRLLERDRVQALLALREALAHTLVYPPKA